MAGLNLSLSLALGSTSVPAQPKIVDNGGPELLLQTELIITGPKTAEGFLVKAAAFPWLEIVDHLRRDPAFLHQFAQAPRRFEEFIAACYERQGFDEVILTPQRGDLGRDVIAIKRGFGSLRFLEQVKAYSPGHLVTHDDVRSMLGVLSLDHGATKGLVTTTSDFQPGILKPDSEFARAIPNRLELKNGAETLKWIESINSSGSVRSDIGGPF